MFIDFQKNFPPTRLFGLHVYSVPWSNFYQNKMICPIIKFEKRFKHQHFCHNLDQKIRWKEITLHIVTRILLTMLGTNTDEYPYCLWLYPNQNYPRKCIIDIYVLIIDFLVGETIDQQIFKYETFWRNCF